MCANCSNDIAKGSRKIKVPFLIGPATKAFKKSIFFLLARPLFCGFPNWFYDIWRAKALPKAALKIHLKRYTHIHSPSLGKNCLIYFIQRPHKNVSEELEERTG